MSHEVELKFDLAAEDVAALRACPSLAGEPARAGQVDTAYFDSKDGAVRRAGYSLRVRRAGGRHVQTVKHKPAQRRRPVRAARMGDARSPGPRLDREALAKTPLGRLLDAAGAGAARPPGPLAIPAHHLAGHAQGQPDRGRARRGHRRRRRRRGAALRARARAQGGQAARLVRAGARRSARAVPLRLGVLSKAERGYALAEKSAERAARAEPVALAAPLSEGEAFRAVAQACLRHYRLNEIVLLAGRDADALHQARIALRRLRSALSLFRPTVRGKDYQEVREELGWLAGQFGDARNLDVLLAGTRASTPTIRRAAGSLKARAKAYDRVEAALGIGAGAGADASARALDRGRRLALPRARRARPGGPRRRPARAAVAPGAAARRQARQGRRRRSPPAAARRQEIALCGRVPRRPQRRRRPKRARRDRFIAALKDLQERLGDLNDAEAAEAMTARLAPGLRGSAERIRREADAGDAVAAAEEALERAAGAAGYWE